jgi:hypothetical protein
VPGEEIGGETFASLRSVAEWLAPRLPEARTAGR